MKPHQNGDAPSEPSTKFDGGGPSGNGMSSSSLSAFSFSLSVERGGGPSGTGISSSESSKGMQKVRLLSILYIAVMTDLRPSLPLLRYQFLQEATLS